MKRKIVGPVSVQQKVHALVAHRKTIPEASPLDAEEQDDAISFFPFAFVRWLSSAPVLATVCFALSLVIYFNSLQHDFTFDDMAAVPRNPAVVGDTSLLQLWTRDFWGTPTSSSLSHKSYRPVASIVLRLFFWIGGGKPFAFHVALVLLNAVICALAVLWVLPNWSPLTRLVAALLYTAHPIKTEAVNGVVGMAELLSAVFGLLAFHVFRTRQADGDLQRGALWAGWLCFVAGLCKETGVMTVLVICAYAVFSHGFASWRKVERWTAAFTAAFLAFGGFLAVRFLAFGWNQKITPSWQDNPLIAMSGFEWFLNVIVIQAKYIQLLFWPRILSCDYSFNALPLSKSLFEVQAIESLLIAAGVFWLFWFAWRRDSRLLLAISWYVAPMLFATHLLGVIGTVVAERLMYIPLLGWALLIGEGLQRVVKAAPEERRAVLTLGFVAILLGATAALSARTMQRNEDWKSNEILFQRTVEDVPQSIKALMNVAGVNFRRGLIAPVVELTERVSKVDPKFCAAKILLGKSYIEIAKDYRSAKKALEWAVTCQLSQRHSTEVLADTYELLATSMLQLGETQQSVGVFQKALDLNFPDAGCNMAVALTRLGRNDEAIRPSQLCVESAMQLSKLHDPSMASQATQKLINFATVLIRAKKYDEGIAMAERAAKMDPSRKKETDELIKTAMQGKK